MASKARLTALALLCFASFSASAVNTPNTLPDFTDATGDQITRQMMEWMEQDWDGDNYPTFTDEEYTRRLDEMSGAIQYKLHPMVKEVIVARTEKYRSSTEQVLGLSDVYFAIFEEHLAKYNVPHHLKYLPIIESRLEPVARSYAGAVGLWQFIPSTGKMYGLQMNSSIDERSDTYKASDAAARLLSELYKYYGDWALALASYNCGPGRVNRAIKDAGTNDYWVVRNFLPTETQKYVPYFMAVAYIGEYYEVHELEPMSYSNDLVLTDTIMTYASKSLYQLAKDLEFNADTLRKLNPGYLKGYVPSNSKGNVIVLPNRIVAKLRGYEERLKEIMADQPENPIRAIRRVNSPEELAQLMRAYRCVSRDVAAWNGLPENYVPQQGDVFVFRKYKPSAEIKIETRKPLETISISALQVIGLDKKNKALTESVVTNVSPSIAQVSSLVMLFPEEAAEIAKAEANANNFVASNLPNMPTASAMTAASMHQVASPIQTQTTNETLAASSAFDRSRDRRVRSSATAIESSPSPSPITSETMPVEVVPNQEQDDISLAVQEAEKLAQQRQQAELNARLQMEQQERAQLAEQLGKQATTAIAERQNKTTTTSPQPSVPNETVTSDNVVYGIVPVAEKSETTNNDRSRERNLRNSNTPVEQSNIVAVSDGNKPNEDADYIYHTVGDKETVLDIHNKFPQMTVRELMELNQLKSESELRTGMVIKIRK